MADWKRWSIEITRNVDDRERERLFLRGGRLYGESGFEKVEHPGRNDRRPRTRLIGMASILPSQIFQDETDPESVPGVGQPWICRPHPLTASTVFDEDPPAKSPLRPDGHPRLPNDPSDPPPPFRERHFPSPRFLRIRSEG
jgi:hypothetical protein